MEILFCECQHLVVGIFDFADNRVIGLEAGKLDNGLFQTVVLDAFGNLNALGIIRIVETQGTAGSEQKLVVRQTESLGGQHGENDAVIGCQFPARLTANTVTLILQVRILETLEDFLDIGEMSFLTRPSPLCCMAALTTA